MSLGCQVDRDNAATIAEFDAENTRLYNGLLEKWFGKKSIERTKELAEQLEKEGYDAHKFMTEKELDIRLIKRYGKKGRRQALADKLMLVIQQYPNISDMVHKSLLTKIPDYVRLRDVEVGKNVYKDIDKENFTINLDRLQEGTLRIALGRALNLVNMTTQSGGIPIKISSYRAMFMTPKGLKWKDPSGAFEAIAAGVRDHANRISSRVNLFMSSPDFIPKDMVDPKLLKKVTRGMESILNDVDILINSGPIENRSEENAKKFQRLFAAVMKGFVIIKNGKFYINQEYERRREYTEDGGKTWTDILWTWQLVDSKTGRYGFKVNKIPKNAKVRPKKYEGTGDVMYSFQDPTLLKNYKNPLGKDSLNIDMNQKQFELFQQYMKEARAVTNLVWDYIAGNALDPKDPNYRAGQMAESTNALMQGLIKHYDGKLDEWHIKQIFFYGQTEYTDFNTGEVIDLLKNLNEIEKEEVTYVQETFSMTATDGIVIANGGSVQPGSPEFRKNYWPTIYNFDVFRQMISIMEKDFKDGVGKTVAAIKKLKIQKKGNWIADLEKLNKILKELQEKHKSALHILNNMDNYHMDNASGSIMHLAADNKHFKRISNAYNIMNSRLDKGVFYDYLKKMMSSVERNRLNLSMLEVLKRLKDERSLNKPRVSPEEMRATLRAAVNYHGSTYSSLKMTGILGDMEGFTRKRNWLRHLNPRERYKKWKYGDDYNINVSPEMQARFLKTLLTTISGLFLQSTRSVTTNASGAHKNIQKKGLKTTMNAFWTMWNKKYKKGIEKIVQQSGITEFSDFFSKSMVNGILEMQIEGQIAELILSEMLLYHNRIGKWGTNSQGKRVKITKDVSREMFNEKVSEYLGKSDLWYKAESLEIRSRGRVLAQQKETRSRMKLYAANKLVQWAINKEYALKPIVKHKDYIAWAKHVAFLPIGKAAVGISKMYQTFPLTMAKAESLIRTLSFVMGAELAWKSGSPGLRNDIHWSEYTDEDAIDKIIQIGIEFQYEMNFGMSIQDVSQYQFGPAQILGKFKYWNQQNAEDEMEIMKQALMYFEELNLETNNLKDIQVKGVGQGIKKMMRLMKYTLTPGLKIDRMARQELAAFKYMMTSGALTAFLYQTFIWNPMSVRKLPGIAQEIIQGTKKFGWKTGMMGQLRNFAITDIMKIITFIPAMIARRGIFGAFIDDDEFEDDEKFWSHFLQMFPFAGYGVTLTYDTVIMIVAKMMDEEELFVEKGERVQSLVLKYGRPSVHPPLVPIGITGEWVRKLGEYSVKAFYDATE